MKILEGNAGALTNFEVLDFLRSKGAGKDASRVLAKVAPSEYKVYDYLVQTAACKQTRENVNEFLERCKKYDLAKAEVLNIINTRPSSVVGIYPIIEDCDNRYGDAVEELVEMVEAVLPPPPTEPELEQGFDGEQKEENANGEQKEETANEEQKEETAIGEQNKEMDEGKEGTADGKQMETS